MRLMSLPTPTLHTARLRLRPFDDADADDLFALHSNAYVLRYWDAPPWSDRARSERFINACRQMAEGGTGARLAVERVSDGVFIGWCRLDRWEPGIGAGSRPLSPPRSVSGQLQLPTGGQLVGSYLAVSRIRCVTKGRKGPVLASHLPVRVPGFERRPTGILVEDGCMIGDRWGV